jgi:hypothetical protein
MAEPTTSAGRLNEAWKQLIATALRRNVVVAVGEHRAAVEAEAAADALRAARGLRDVVAAMPGWPGSRGREVEGGWVRRNDVLEQIGKRLAALEEPADAGR